MLLVFTTISQTTEAKDQSMFELIKKNIKVLLFLFMALNTNNKISLPSTSILFLKSYDHLQL